MLIILQMENNKQERGQTPTKPTQYITSKLKHGVSVATLE